MCLSDKGGLYRNSAWYLFGAAYFGTLVNALSFGLWLRQGCEEPVASTVSADKRSY